jgi:hypothetical protein
MTIRPDYNSPKPLAYINKVIRKYNRLPVTLVRAPEGYHTLRHDKGQVIRIPAPHTKDLRLGDWVIQATEFARANAPQD